MALRLMLRRIIYKVPEAKHTILEDRYGIRRIIKNSAAPIKDKASDILDKAITLTKVNLNDMIEILSPLIKLMQLFLIIA